MTIGTFGVLAAGTIAGIAVYNVASSSSVDSELAAVVATTPAVTSLEPLTPADLPSVPVVEAPASIATATPQTSPEPTAPAPSDASTQVLVSKSTASALVLAESPGLPLKVTQSARKGYQAWAVQVRRTDGSVVTAYVDRASGVIFEWTVDQQAPVVAQGGGEVEDDDHEEDEHEEDEHEEGDDD